jgi:hypothetical protein
MKLSQVSKYFNQIIKYEKDNISKTILNNFRFIINIKKSFIIYKYIWKYNYGTLLYETLANNIHFQRASENGHTQIIKLLLNNKRFNPGAFGSKAIEIASKNGRTEIIRLLAEDKRVNKKLIDADYILQYITYHGFNFNIV